MKRSCKLNLLQRFAMSLPVSRLFRRRLSLVFLSTAFLWTLSAAGATTQSGGTLCGGTRWETPYYVQKSDRPGPTVLISGGVHGDEPAGAAAADQIRCWPITSGTLIVLPRANVPGLAAHTRLMPGVTADQANLNRNFPKAGQPGPATGQPADAIWAWVQAMHTDWLVDLHEGTGVHGAGSTSVGSSLIVCPSPEAERMAGRMLDAVNDSISDARKKFVHIGPPVDDSLARAAGEHLKIRAMIAETSINDLPPPGKVKTAKVAVGTAKTKTAKKPSAVPRKQPLSRRVRQHRLMACCLLKELDMLDAKFDPDQMPIALPASPLAKRRPRVALYDAGGTGGQGEFAVERILRDRMEVLHVGPEEITAGALAHFDLLIVPGGSGSAEAKAIGEKGRGEIRHFVENGGGYLGICAGAYLATSGFDWSLKILNAKTVSSHWERGRATLTIELTPEGRRILGDRPGMLEVLYHNGPVVCPAAIKDLPEYHVLAYFRTEVVKKNVPAGLMTGSPAIAIGRFGQGHVVFISPHPEQSAALEDIVRNAAQWGIDGKSPPAK